MTKVHVLFIFRALSKVELDKIPNYFYVTFGLYVRCVLPKLE
jgi:hypothetical protein